jgi:citrate lyase subunit beta/citryl-CoA lyase
MTPRSLLFVPADRPERMGKAMASGADAVILDLEDAVAPERKAFARDAAAAFLAGAEGAAMLMVRINALDSGLADLDLAAIARARLDAIMLPKAQGAGEVADLAARLAALGVDAPPLIPIAAETPAAVLRLGEFAGLGEGLLGLTWGAEDLLSAMGATASREEDGRYTPPFALARSLVLFAAQAAGVAAIETVYPDFRDLDGLAAQAARAARDGFSGMMAIHPSQVGPINAAFSPSAEAVARAQAIVAAFADQPEAGALSLDGRMIDRPHLARARRLLAGVGRVGAT